MSKKKKPKNNKQNSLLVKVEGIDEKALAREIIEAYAEYEHHKKTEEDEKEQVLQEEWLKILNQKDYPKEEPFFGRKCHKIRNDFFLLKNVLFIKSKDVRDMRATFGLMQLCVEGIFWFCKWVLYICAASIIYGICIGAISVVLGSMLAFVLWVLARLFRIASFEIEKIQDGNLLIAIFSGALSFAAVVIAIITIVVDKA